MLVFAIFSATLGMFQFGYNTGVMNAPQKVLEEYISNVYKSRTGNWISEELRDILWSIIVSVFAIGGMIGGMLAPFMANCCGRKTGLVLNNTVAVLGVTLMSSSQLGLSIESLVAGRFFIGLNCGLNTALVPMYLTEISTVNVRGALGTVSQLGVTLGLLFSQVLGLKELLGTNEHWPFLFAFAFIPAILQLIMLPFCPESPRYLLLTCGRVNDARIALRKLRNEADIEIDIEEMRAESQAQYEEIAKHGRLFNFRDLLNHPWLRTPLLIGIMMQLSQQLSGINAIFYYSTDIFISADVPETYAVYATIGVGAIMVIMALISMPLVDRVGRRTLHLYGLAGMFLASIFLTISLLVKFLYDWMRYISVISILFYTLFFGIGPSSIPWMITAELFTQDSRPTAMSVAVLVNWLTNFVVGLTFPLMKRVLQSYLFLPFTVFLAIFWIFTYKKLPETKNRTFEEIASLFRPVSLGQFPSPTNNDFGCPANNFEGFTDSPLDGGNTLRAQQTEPALAEQAMSNRFRFDESPALRNSPHCYTSGCQNYSNSNFREESRMIPNTPSPSGKVNMAGQPPVPNTSCTSIALNLSTNDQQPLIADDHYQPDLHRAYSTSWSQKNINPVFDDAQVCLRTTSFMANQKFDGCRCCHMTEREPELSKCNQDQYHHQSLTTSGNLCGSLPKPGERISMNFHEGYGDDGDDDEDEPNQADARDLRVTRSRTLNRADKSLIEQTSIRLQASSSSNNLDMMNRHHRRLFVASDMDDADQRL